MSRVDGGIKIVMDTSEINKLIGAGFAIGGFTQRSRYIRLLINGAVPIALDDFNNSATAFAMSSGGLKHMFEWGTSGINNGRSNRRQNPNSESARLWHNLMLSDGTSTVVRFQYKVSLANVPKPTKKDTGISTDIINKLKWHQFNHKAEILEMGIPVKISPKPDNKKKILFVPNLWKGEKGFSIYKRDTNPNVSKDTKGTFTMYWINFWQGRGTEVIQRDVNDNLIKDLEAVMHKIEYGKQGPLKPVVMTNSKGQIEISRKKILRELERAARARLGNYEY